MAAWAACSLDASPMLCTESERLRVYGLLVLFWKLLLTPVNVCAA